MTLKQFLTPQEIEVWYILPALRRAIALELQHKGLRQNKIAELLGITEAAVSQYLSGKRGTELKFEMDVAQKIEQSAEKIKNNGDLLEEIESLCKLIRNKMITCKIHKKYGVAKKTCEVCFK
ncbi:helix-turn-helix domain-containing protein [Candidatus Woesearchaeota archaeon]|nr:helix-turn-helix domain-containing protein [Candidatus Woesearchaeota archaeon]